MKNSTRPTQETLTKVGVELDKIAEQVVLFPETDLDGWLTIKSLIRGLTRFEYPSDQLEELGRVLTSASLMALAPNKSQARNLNDWFYARNNLVGYINKVSASKAYNPTSVGYNLIEALRKIQNNVSLIK